MGEVSFTRHSDLEEKLTYRDMTSGRVSGYVWICTVTAGFWNRCGGHFLHVLKENKWLAANFLSNAYAEAPGRRTFSIVVSPYRVSVDVESQVAVAVFETREDVARAVDLIEVRALMEE